MKKQGLNEDVPPQILEDEGQHHEEALAEIEKDNPAVIEALNKIERALA